MDFVSRLKQYLSLRGISVTQFADECDIPRPTASQLLAGRNKKVSDEIIGKIHITYPDVSVVWLMFGEGDMLTTGNIKVSNPQNRAENGSLQPQRPDTKSYSEFEQPIFDIKTKSAEKNMTVADNEDHAPYGYSDLTFAFPSGQDKATVSTENSATQNTVQATTKHQGAFDEKNGKSTPSQTPSISITPGLGKCVTGIVVYYSDSTYESFVPDPEGRHPFMR